MKKSILLFMTLAVSCLYAQNGITNEHRFGVGADSIKCLENIFLVNQALKPKSPSYETYTQTYPLWKDLFDNYPVARVDTYTNGIKLLKGLIAKEADAQKKAAYIDELMAVHDQQIKYIDQLQAITKTELSLGAMIGKKALDYMQIVPNAVPDSIYAMLATSVEMEKGKSEYLVTEQFMKHSALKYKRDQAAHGEQIIEDYLNASVYIVEVLDKYYERIEFYNNRYKELQDPKDSTRAEGYSKMIDYARISRNNVDAYFINSGAASCNDLNKIYAANIEANKENIDYLNKVISVMSMLKCTNEDAYLLASEYSLALAPTSKAAMGCGYRYFKRGDVEKAMELFNQAIELESSVTNKAEMCYKVGAVHYSLKNYSKARAYALQAISLNSKFGQPYILIAQCYAATPNWTNDPIMSKCTYFAALDKLYRAKAIDPSVKKEADKFIASYSTYTPETTDLFMKGYKTGDAVTIGGWINERTTIR